MRTFVGSENPDDFEHAWPEQRVEVRDVLADEMVDLDIVAAPPVVQSLAVPVTPLLRGSDVADGSIEPDVPVVAGTVGDLESEIGCGSRDIPIAQRFVAGNGPSDSWPLPAAGGRPD